MLQNTIAYFLFLHYVTKLINYITKLNFLNAFMFNIYQINLTFSNEMYDALWIYY